MKQNRLAPSILLGLNYFKKIETKEAHHTNQDTTLSPVEAGSRFKGDRDLPAIHFGFILDGIAKKLR